MILSLEQGLKPIRYMATDHDLVMRRFLNNHENVVRSLLAR